MQPDTQLESTLTPKQPEQQTVPVEGGSERIPVMPAPEGGIETGAERKEQASEASAAAADAASAGAPLAPPPVAPVVVDDTAVSDSPLVAADDEVIEKEWVDKAKQIIAQTKDDPHARTSKVNQLQRDYLKKRYGKDLGAATQ